MTDDRALMKFDEDEFRALYSIMLHCLKRDEDRAVQAWQRAIEDHCDNLMVQGKVCRQ